MLMLTNLDFLHGNLLLGSDNDNGNGTQVTPKGDPKSFYEYQLLANHPYNDLLMIFLADFQHTALSEPFSYL